MTNADKANPGVEITILGEKRTLIFTMDAFCLLEEATGIDALAGEFWQRLDARTVTSLLWAGLCAGGMEMSLKEFRQKITPRECKIWRAVLEKQIKDASPDPEMSDEKPEAEEKKEAAPESDGALIG